MQLTAGIDSRAIKYFTGRRFAVPKTGKKAVKILTCYSSKLRNYIGKEKAYETKDITDFSW